MSKNRAVLLEEFITNGIIDGSKKFINNYGNLYEDKINQKGEPCFKDYVNDAILDIEKSSSPHCKIFGRLGTVRENPGYELSFGPSYRKGFISHLTNTKGGTDLVLTFSNSVEPKIYNDNKLYHTLDTDKLRQCYGLELKVLSNCKKFSIGDNQHDYCDEASFFIDKESSFFEFDINHKNLQEDYGFVKRDGRISTCVEGQFLSDIVRGCFILDNLIVNNFFCGGIIVSNQSKEISNTCVKERMIYMVNMLKNNKFLYHKNTDLIYAPSACLLRNNFSLKINVFDSCVNKKVNRTYIPYLINIERTGNDDPGALLIE